MLPRGLGCDHEIVRRKVALGVDDRKPICWQWQGPLIHGELDINLAALASAAPLPLLGSLHELRLERIALDVAAHSEKVERIDDSYCAKSRLIDSALTDGLGSASVATRMRPGEPMKKAGNITILVGP